MGTRKLKKLDIVAITNCIDRAKIEARREYLFLENYRPLGSNLNQAEAREMLERHFFEEKKEYLFKGSDAFTCYSFQAYKEII